MSKTRRNSKKNYKKKNYKKKTRIRSSKRKNNNNFKYTKRKIKKTKKRTNKIGGATSESMYAAVSTPPAVIKKLNIYDKSKTKKVIDEKLVKLAYTHNELMWNTYFGKDPLIRNTYILTYLKQFESIVYLEDSDSNIIAIATLKNVNIDDKLRSKLQKNKIDEKQISSQLIQIDTVTISPERRNQGICNLFISLIIKLYKDTSFICDVAVEKYKWESETNQGVSGTSNPSGLGNGASIKCFENNGFKILEIDDEPTFYEYQGLIKQMIKTK